MKKIMFAMLAVVATALVMAVPAFAGEGEDPPQFDPSTECPVIGVAIDTGFFIEPVFGTTIGGCKGTDGANGAQGATGATGAKGDKGDKGDTGATGATGQDGASADLCPNLKGVQSSVPAGKVLALNLRRQVVCVTKQQANAWAKARQKYTIDHLNAKKP